MSRPKSRTGGGHRVGAERCVRPYQPCRMPCIFRVTNRAGCLVSIVLPTAQEASYLSCLLLQFFNRFVGKMGLGFIFRNITGQP